MTEIDRVKLDFIHTTNAQNLSYRLKVNEFTALTTSESVSGCSGHKHKRFEPNNVWSDLKHVGTHEHGECSNPWFEL